MVNEDAKILADIFEALATTDNPDGVKLHDMTNIVNSKPRQRQLSVVDVVGYLSPQIEGGVLRMKFEKADGNPLIQPYVQLCKPLSIK